MKERLRPYWILFSSFCRIGGLTFGGGYAMLPMLQREVVDRYGWCTNEELLDYFAIGQCTPGIIAVNTATFVGNKIRGVKGAVVATVGVIFPSFLIISALAMVLNRFAYLPMVQHAMAGIRVAVCALILSAVIKLLKSSVKNLIAALILLAAMAVALFTEISPVFVVLAAALLGIALGRRKKA